MKSFLNFTENLLSGMLPFVLLIGCGIFFTLRGRFFQFRRFGESVRLVCKAFSAKKSKNEISSFQAACTALSATVGTGNIAGVAGAISLGGAGAIFWMWISALAGMAVKFGEIKLSIIYREKSNGEYRGGPMYYIKNALPSNFKFLGVIFNLAAIPAVMFSGNVTQTNAAVMCLELNEKGSLVVGIIFAVATAAVAMGGMKRIGTVTEKLVPAMSVIYIILSLGIIALNIDFLPTAFKMIFEGAFSPKAVTGGVIGSAMKSMIIGASRGVFSNEAGLGTSAMAHSVAADADEKTQGLFGVFEVFVDTLLICTLTALTILCSRVNIDYGTTASSELVRYALSSGFGNAGYFLLAVMMCIFAFSSIIGWAVYGDICTCFMFGKTGRLIFLMIYPFGCIIGAVCNSVFAWRISALLNGIMLCTNLIAVLLLGNEFLSSEVGRK